MSLVASIALNTVRKEQWPLFRLDEVTPDDAPIVYGILQPGPYLKNGIPYIRPAEIQNDEILVNDLRKTSVAIANRYRRSSLQAGDVILSIVGTIGKVVVVPTSLAGANITQSSVRIRPRPDFLLPEFLAWVLRSPISSRQYQSSMLGSAVMRLNVAHVRGILIPVPPLEVQRITVAEIDKRFTWLESGNTLLARVKRNLIRYRLSVYKAACEGRLVANQTKLSDPNAKHYASVVELLESTPPPAKPSRWKSRSTDLILGHAALAVGNPKTQLPKGWKWVALTEIAKMESGHTPSRAHPSWWNGKIPWVGLADARSHNGGLISDTLQHVNAEGLANSAARLLPTGTVCVSRTAAIGYVIILGSPMATSQDFVNWVPTQAVSAGWLQIVFSADTEALRRFGKGSIHTTIYFPELLALHIALPPMPEQLRIITEVDRRLTLIASSQSIVATNLNRLGRLRRCILAEAFSPGVATGEKVFESTLYSETFNENRPAQLSKKELIMPAKKTKNVSRKISILDVLRRNPEGITVEDLFIASGYFEAGSPDEFYQELNSHIRNIDEIRPNKSINWPASSSVRLKLKKKLK